MTFKMPVRRNNTLVNVIRTICVLVIIAGGVIVALQDRRLKKLVPEHQRLSKKVAVIGKDEPDRVHVVQLESDNPLVWKWRIIVPKGRTGSYVIFSRIGKIGAEDHQTFAEFSKRKQGQSVTVASRYMPVRELEHFDAGELGAIVTYSFDFDDVGGKWFTKTDFKNTLNQFPEAYQFLLSPDKFVVESAGASRVESFEIDEVFQLFRIREKALASTAMINGEEVDLYHGIYTFIVHVSRAAEFRESTKTTSYVPLPSRNSLKDKQEPSE